MDLDLPQISGYEAAIQIKKLSPDTFIIATTGYEDEKE